MPQRRTARRADRATEARVARRKPDTSGATEVLHEIESLGERLAQWVSENWRLAAAIVAGILLAAALYGAWISWSRGRAEEASAALASVREEYLHAMGATPGALEIPELANPEAAESVRTEFRERFAEVAREHSGTAAGALAWIAAGDLAQEAGDAEAAVSTWQDALDDVGDHEALRGALLQRIARAHERAGRWNEAAEAHQQAGGLEDFPLHPFALADAARAWDTAGQPDRALQLFERLETRHPDFPLPDYLRARVRELRALAASEELGASG